jgi:hypothetical protein
MLVTITCIVFIGIILVFVSVQRHSIPMLIVGIIPIFMGIALFSITIQEESIVDPTVVEIVHVHKTPSYILVSHEGGVIKCNEAYLYNNSTNLILTQYTVKDGFGWQKDTRLSLSVK